MDKRASTTQPHQRPTTFSPARGGDSVLWNRELCSSARTRRATTADTLDLHFLALLSCSFSHRFFMLLWSPALIHPCTPAYIQDCG
jgi:hypothetical protein